MKIFPIFTKRNGTILKIKNSKFKFIKIHSISNYPSYPNFLSLSFFLIPFFSQFCPNNFSIESQQFFQWTRDSSENDFQNFVYNNIKPIIFQTQKKKKKRSENDCQNFERSKRSKENGKKFIKRKIRGRHLES